MKHISGKLCCVPAGRKRFCLDFGNQFVCEAWFNLGESRAYAMINPNCANTERIELVTPFGKYTPRERDIISLEQLKTAVYEYYHNLEEADFLAKVPHEKIEL